MRTGSVFLDFGPPFASQKLRELYDLDVDHETLRRWLVEEGLWKRRKKRGPHRKKRPRPRKERFGELVQIDGSHHDWFGNAGKACLMNMVDDATGVTYSLMFEEETTEAAMRVLWGWIERYGIPKALYADRKNVYVTERELTLKEEIAGEEALTAFGKACRKLGIRIITARSPQAKGRVVILVACRGYPENPFCCATLRLPCRSTYSLINASNSFMWV